MSGRRGNGGGSGRGNGRGKHGARVDKAFMYLYRALVPFIYSELKRALTPALFFPYLPMPEDRASMYMLLRYVVEKRWQTTFEDSSLGSRRLKHILRSLKTVALNVRDGHHRPDQVAADAAVRNTALILRAMGWPELAAKVAHL